MLPFLDGFSFFLRPPSSSQRQMVDSADSAPTAPAESGGSGSARGQSASGQVVVPKFTRAKKFMLKQSPQ